jgi:hypothetical protein
VTQPPADDAKDVSFVGTATSASESQARAAAAEDATRKATAHIVARLFRDLTGTSFPGVDALREYLRKVARSPSDSPYIRPNPGGGYAAYVLLQLNKGFAEPATVRQYTATPISAYQQASAAVGYLLVPSDVGPAAVTRWTQVRMQKLRQGNFTLSFSIAGTQKGQVWIRLDQVKVFDDGSPGATRWKFDVFVDGRAAFSAPIEAYSDDVVIYRMRAGDPSVETQARPATGVIEVKIVGTRTTAASAK